MIIQKRNSAMTIGEAFDLFQEYKKTTTENGSSYNFEINYFLKIIGLSTDDPVNSIDKFIVLKFIKNLQNKNLKTASINHYIRSIKAVFYWFMEEGFIEQFKIKTIPGQQPAMKTYSEDDLKKLLVKPKKSDEYVTWRSWLIVNILINTGCRLSTLINLKQEDIDFQHQEIFYRHLKNKSVAVVFLSDTLSKAIKMYNYTFFMNNYTFLLCNINGDQMNKQTVERSIEKYCKSRDVEYKGIHTFRHTYASMFIRNNGNPMILQKILTHNTFNATKNYIHLYGEDVKLQMNQFNPVDSLTSPHTKLIVRR